MRLRASRSVLACFLIASVNNVGAQDLPREFLELRRAIGSFPDLPPVDRAVGSLLATSRRVYSEANIPKLHEAAGLGRTDEVRRLLDAGADVNLDDGHGRTPLNLATRYKHLETARLLIARGANVNPVPDRFGHSLLEIAAGESSFPLLTELVRSGADPKRQGDMALLEAIPSVNSTLLLLAFGADPDGKGGSEIPLLKATFEWSEPIVAALILKKANLNAQNPHGLTSLMLASQRGTVAIARRLIAAGADVNVREKGGRTALWIANQKVESKEFSKRKSTIAELLKKAGGKE